MGTFGLRIGERMYTVSVEDSFSALHRVRYPDGTREPSHGHDWVVRVYFRRPMLDDHGMVIDFVQAQTMLKSIVSLLHYANLNEIEIFVGLNPTAEVVAKYVFDRVYEQYPDTLLRVEVTEAPGCVASYERKE